MFRPITGVMALYIATLSVVLRPAEGTLRVVHNSSDIPRVYSSNDTNVAGEMQETTAKCSELEPRGKEFVPTAPEIAPSTTVNSSWPYTETRPSVLGEKLIPNQPAQKLSESPAESLEPTTPRPQKGTDTSRAVQKIFTDASERKETTNADPFGTTPRYRDISEDRPRYAKDPKYQNLPWPAMVDVRRTTQQKLSRTSEVTSAVTEIKQSTREPHSSTTKEETYEAYNATANPFDDEV